MSGWVSVSVEKLHMDIERRTDRLRVPGGWLYRLSMAGRLGPAYATGTAIFVPDEAKDDLHVLGPADRGSKRLVEALRLARDVVGSSSFEVEQEGGKVVALYEEIVREGVAPEYQYLLDALWFAVQFVQSPSVQRQRAAVEGQIAAALWRAS